ncbi:hypothetical protein Tco_1094550 [Tanacetum coccineum]|uniref:Uncharacterized protein n=1 Tax=Tanacetum coccineum TaxID=301880 RepID=A0ABQ5IFZ6_9ASTR
MSADSVVTYTSVHSEARSWSIPSEDLTGRCQSVEQAPCSPKYVPVPHGAGGSCTSVLSGAEHPEDLVPGPHHCYYTLPTPSIAAELTIPEADMPPQKWTILTTQVPGCEIGESSAAAAARQPGPTMAHRVDHSHVDTMETRFRDIERRMMIALEMVNRRERYGDPSALARYLKLMHGITRHEVTVFETEVHRPSGSVRAADDLVFSISCVPDPGGWSMR